jgi:hypothetical protein
VCGVASHPDWVQPAAVAVVDLGDGGLGDREPGGTDQLLDLVRPPGFDCVIDGGQEKLLGSEVVVGLVGDEFLEPGRDMGDAQGTELVVVDAGEDHRPTSCSPSCWLIGAGLSS